MANINKIEPEYLEKFDIHCNNYLTYAQIQHIVEATMKFDSWGERQQNIDMLLLVHATDMDVKEIEGHSHDEFLESGLIDAVKYHVCNYEQVVEALEWTESTPRALGQILKILNSFLETPTGKNIVQKTAKKMGAYEFNKH